MISGSTNGSLTRSDLIPQSNQNPTPVACKCADSTVCHIPGSEAREQQKQLIYQAVKEGKLFLREIDLDLEAKYLGSEKRDPRPFYKVMQGVNVKMRTGKLTVGTLKLTPLAFYKCNAVTYLIANSNGNLSELEVKCLPDFRSMQEKMREQAERAWEIYPAFTSGHLLPDGTYSPPKLKSGQNSGLINHSELLSSGYEVKQIKCVCIDKEEPSWNISDALQKKQELEKKLGTGPLPLVVYSYKGGSIEVYFDEELAGNNLAFNEVRLGDFSLTHKLSEEVFRGLLNLLPTSLKSDILNRQTLNISLDLVEVRQEILQLVKKPDWQSYQRSQALKNSKFPLQSRFFVDGLWTTLLDQLSLFEIQRYGRGDESKSDDARLIFVDLFNRGVPISDYYCRSVLEECYPPWLSCYLKALNISPKRESLDGLINDEFPESPAAILEFHQFCDRATPIQLAETLLHIFKLPFWNGDEFACFYPPLLALFRYFTPDRAAYKKLKNHFDQNFNNCLYKKLSGIHSRRESIKWVKKLWRNREQEPFYQIWPKLVQQAQQEMIVLRIRVGLHVQSPSLNEPTGNELAELQFLAEAFSVAPVLAAAGDNEATILAVLNHYYRRSGPERVVKCLGLKALPKIWKPHHACNHVLRVRINALWYIELLEKFTVMTFSDSEKDLLALAAIYHDAAAEDVPKADEESKAAFYFKRDLAGHYPAQLLEDMAMALAGKEDDLPDSQPLAKPVSEKLRSYLHVLRFADRLDVIRCTGVPSDFFGLAKTSCLVFDASRLDLPVPFQATTTDQKSAAQIELEAAMHGAADLVQVTGHLSFDGRAVPYVSAYRLAPDSEGLNLQFEWTPTPRQRMDDFVDNNVRRKIALLVGLNTCSTADHKECRTDTQNGRTWGIHNSWHDLKQVRIPERMTLLEKMQFEHNEGLLSQATRDEIQKEVERLRCQGIPMQLGTLTQTTLESPAAKRTLEDKGIKVVSVKRLRGYKKDGRPRKQEMLVPVYAGSDFGSS